MVASAEQPGFAMPAAGWAAKSGQPVLWVTRDAIPPSTRAAITAHKRPQIYVLGPESAISARVEKQLGELGQVKRVSGADPVANAIAFAREPRPAGTSSTPATGSSSSTPSGRSTPPSAAPLSASGTYGPQLLLTEGNALPAPLQDYLLDIQPGYDEDPVRGVYNHGWMIGDENAISVDVQARIDSLLEIQSVDRGKGS